MTDITLVPMTRADAEEVLGRAVVTREWAEGYPTEGDVEVATWLVAGTVAPVTPEAPFGPWLVVADSGLVVGGVGFHGPPDAEGLAEIGYGVAPSMRGQGVASAAVRALRGLASLPGVRTLVAGTDPGNVASQRVLEVNGFVCDGTDGDELRWLLPMVGASD